LSTVDLSTVDDYVAFLDANWEDAKRRGSCMEMINITIEKTKLFNLYKYRARGKAFPKKPS